MKRPSCGMFSCGMFSYWHYLRPADFQKEEMSAFVEKNQDVDFEGPMDLSCKYVMTSNICEETIMTWFQTIQ